ncbi:hypothetical protein NQ317_014664 [Molorchus minor]|uniref:Uncharacterized protein n=1 Tax=Molorchus minor TaxID=1323400 RepID=A0ABQ9JC74_9CUCU|nr:hypothetical protein NQ317_014664 [Molorchus minor]
MVVQQTKKRPNREWYCDVCGAYLRSIEGILEGDKVVTCTRCQGRVCKHRCSNLSEHKGWTCNSCLRPPESWFQGILSAIQPTSKVELKTTMNSEPLNETDEDLEELRKKEKEEVREFIERLVSAMLGEDVDEASVTKLYNDKHCKW